MTEFLQYFNLEMMGWQGGTKMYAHGELIEVAKTICNSIINSGAWHAVDPNDGRLVALNTQLEELSKSVLPEPAPAQPTCEMPEWRKKKGEPQI